MTIKVLPPQVANQIAAGEVVERPAAVVKELVENCLDAGATRILVEIVNGGAKKILIRDDGCGIPHDELALALRRHATSKLSSIQDLNRLTSMGFRGEALASIAAVTRLTLTSKPREQDMAYAVEVEGLCQEPKISPASHPDGTTIEALDLFFNTPARRRFLKSEKTEFMQIEEVFRRIAVSRPDVAFVLKNNGKVVYDLKPVTGQNEIRRLESLLGRSVTSDMSFFEWSDCSLSIRGYVSVRAQNKPVQYFFVNRRIVRDKVVIHAVREAYEAVFGVKGDVSYICFLDMNPEDVDINVHPQKFEVRFQESRRVHDFIQTSVMNVFRNAGMVLPETMSETASSQQNHHYAGVKPVSFDREAVAGLWAGYGASLENKRENSGTTAPKSIFSEIERKDLSELLSSGNDERAGADNEKNALKPATGAGLNKGLESSDVFRSASHDAASGKPAAESAGAPAGDNGYGRLFNLNRGAGSGALRPTFSGGHSGKVKWSEDAMSKMFGTERSSAEMELPVSESAEVSGLSVSALTAGQGAGVAVSESLGFTGTSEADDASIPDLPDPWMKDEISEYSLYRTVMITDDGQCAVISNGSSLKIVRLKVLAEALFTDAFETDGKQLLRPVNLLVPFDFRDGGITQNKASVLHELGFVLRTCQSGFTVLAVPAVVRKMNLAGVMGEIVAGIDEDTGIREAVRILAGILFKARVPASFSSKMTARLVQSITYEKYFEEKLSTGFENIDLSEHISNLLKK